MTFVYFYIIFAIATGISATYELYWPLVKQAKYEGVKNEFTRSPYLCFVVFTCICTLLAPAVILVIFVPKLYQSAYIGLQTEIMRENPDLN